MKAFTQENSRHVDVITDENVCYHFCGCCYKRIFSDNIFVDLIYEDNFFYRLCGCYKSKENVCYYFC